MKKFIHASMVFTGLLVVSLQLCLAISSESSFANRATAHTEHSGRAAVQPQRRTVPPITIALDATEAPRKILHARLSIPARPGPMTLVYPKWIPGEHGPTGPITDLAGVKITTGGKAVPWRHDVDMYAFHVEVPGGADMLDVERDASRADLLDQIIKPLVPRK